MGNFFENINGYLWGFPMIAFLFLTHLTMTVKTGFVQRKVFAGIRLSVKKDGAGGEAISPFAALATSLASTLGTGNIIGVGTAVAMGGAGAVFWCWITGVFGMATQYCECVLSVKYRDKDAKNEYAGGPMYVLKNAIGSRRISKLYALLAAVGGLITGAAIQTNAISSTLAETLNMSAYDRSTSWLLSFLVGGGVSLLVALVIFGGLKSVSQICCMVVPFMAAAYTIGCVAVLVINREYLWDSIRLIVTQAFSLQGAAGGAAGSVMMLSCRYGASRGLFSNEAGIGTSSVICASARASSPIRQGLISMTATFWDTVVMCLVTGVVVVSTTLADTNVKMQGASLCYEAFCRIPYVGRGILVFSMITFAFSTVLGWSAIGEKCVTFVFGTECAGTYRVLWIAAVFASAFVSLDGIWAMGDFINALLVVPNVWGLYMLCGEVGADTKKELKHIK